MMNFSSNDCSHDAFRRYIYAFKSLLSKQAAPAVFDNFNLEVAQKLLSEFKQLCTHATNYSNDINIFELCALGHDEVKNCRILAWLLDENAKHGLGHRFLEELILLGCEPNEMLCFKEALETSYATRTEICPNADNTDRVDIVCESLKMLVFIEVKIDSNEHTSQTDRYYTRLIHNSAGRQNKLIFISVDDTPSNMHAKNIKWKDIGAIASKISCVTTSPFIQTLLIQYSNFVMSF